MRSLVRVQAGPHRQRPHPNRAAHDGAKRLAPTPSGNNPTPTRGPSRGAAVARPRHTFPLRAPNPHAQRPGFGSGGSPVASASGTVAGGPETTSALPASAPPTRCTQHQRRQVIQRVAKPCAPWDNAGAKGGNARPTDAAPSSPQRLRLDRSLQMGYKLNCTVQFSKEGSRARRWSRVIGEVSGTPDGAFRSRLRFRQENVKGAKP